EISEHAAAERHDAEIAEAHSADGAAAGKPNVACRRRRDPAGLQDFPDAMGTGIQTPEAEVAVAIAYNARFAHVELAIAIGIDKTVVVAIEEHRQAGGAGFPGIPHQVAVVVLEHGTADGDQLEVANSHARNRDAAGHDDIH